MCTIQRIVHQMTDNKYKVIDNYLSDDDFKTLKDIIFNTEFPWYHNENIVTDDELLKDLNGIPFYYQVHLIYQDNKYLLILSNRTISKINYNLDDLNSRANNCIFAQIENPDDDLIFAIILKIPKTHYEK